MDIYQTYFMLAAVEEMPLEHRFFRRRYFPTNKMFDVFGSPNVLADFKENTQKKAPFVLPRVGGIPVTRDGFSTFMLEPANISVSMPLTIDQLNQRQFGESLLSDRSPADRAKIFLMGDLQKLGEMIERSEEILSVKTIMDNGTIMRHRTDNPEIYEDVGAKFYDGENNPALFTPAAAWTHSKYVDGKWEPGSWYYDICAMVQSLKSAGRPVSEILVSDDVGNFLMEDGWILTMLDNRNVNMGGISPAELTVDEYQLGTFNFKGRRLPIIVSCGTYENDSGADVHYLPSGTVIAISPNCGRGLYGAVTQVEGKAYKTYKGMRVPNHIVTEKPPMIETELTSRPLFVPIRSNPWRVAKNVLG